MGCMKGLIFAYEQWIRRATVFVQETESENKPRFSTHKDGISFQWYHALAID
jgi:hypothetical protein